LPNPFAKRDVDARVLVDGIVNPKATESAQEDRRRTIDFAIFRKLIR
jgi:hypothetical protein